MTPLRRALGQRAPMLWLLLPLMAGLSLGKLASVPLSVSAVMAVGVITAGLAIWRCQTRLWSVWIGLSVICSGAALYELRRARLPDWDGLPPREAKLTFRVERLFSPSQDSRKVSGLATVLRAEGHLREMVGQSLYFTGRLARGVARPIRTAEVEGIGRLEVLPKNPPADTFDGYLGGSGVNFKLTRARLTREVAAPSRYWRLCAAVQDKMTMILGFGLEAHPDLTGVLRAMLLGQLFELSDEQDAGYKQTGTLHLFSISGLHIGVIVVAIGGVLKLMRFPALLGFLLTAALVWLYVDINGRAPSAVRSFLMFGLLYSSRVFRAPRGSMSALVVSALAVLLVDPMQLFSASFQMSYGIVASLLALGLPLAEYWKERGALFEALPPANWGKGREILNAAWRKFLDGAALGLSTALVGALTGVLYFGLFTPGSLIANFVMIPVSMVALLAGFASLVAGLTGGLTLSVIFNHAAALVFFGMNAATAEFVRVPGVFFQAKFAAPWIGFSALAGLIGLILIGFHAGWPRRWCGYWAPFAYTAAVLILLVTFSKSG